MTRNTERRAYFCYTTAPVFVLITGIVGSGATSLSALSLLAIGLAISAGLSFVLYPER